MIMYDYFVPKKKKKKKKKKFAQEKENAIDHTTLNYETFFILKPKSLKICIPV